jgi:hypothetical protein
MSDAVRLKSSDNLPPVDSLYSTSRRSLLILLLLSLVVSAFQADTVSSVVASDNAQQIRFHSLETDSTYNFAFHSMPSLVTELIPSDHCHLSGMSLDFVKPHSPSFHQGQFRLLNFVPSGLIREHLANRPLQTFTTPMGYTRGSDLHNRLAIGKTNRYWVGAVLGQKG